MVVAALLGARERAAAQANDCQAVGLGPGGSLQPGVAPLGLGSFYSPDPGVATTEVPTYSMGVFQITVQPSFYNCFYNSAYTQNPIFPGYYPGFNPTTGNLTSPVLFDGTTQMSTSAMVTPGTVNYSLPGVQVGTGAYQDYITSFSEIQPVPAVVQFANPATHELFTEIDTFSLVPSSNCVCELLQSQVPCPIMTSQIPMVIAG
jgi:hypothetical protein